ncbi:MAG: T9SS type A sorting domain-containing protein [Bacteroidota bacterium]
MKKFFTLFFLSLMLGSALDLKAQENDIYFAEGFEGGTISTANPSASVANQNDYFGQGVNSAGTWYIHNAYRTTGSSCASATYGGATVVPGTNHIRLLNPTTPAGTGAVTADTAYVATPVLDFGIGTITILRSSASSSTFTTRRMSYWITTDASDAAAAIHPTATGQTTWTRVAISYISPQCIDTNIIINSSTARRLAISVTQAANADFDSLTVRSFLDIVPVKFGSISALNANGLTKLTWSSETEYNTQSYVIERSTDGFNYTQVGILNATGANKYTWMDNAPLSTKSFYRVKGLDKTGSSNYSSVVKINPTLKEMDLTVAPNPVKNGKLNLQMNNFSKGQYTVNIYNNASQKVFTKILANDGGTSSQLVQLPSTLKSGVYNLQLLGDAVKMTKRLVVE